MVRPQGFVEGRIIRDPYLRNFGEAIIAETQIELDQNPRGFRQRIFVRAFGHEHMGELMRHRIGESLRITGTFDVEVHHVPGPPEKHFANLSVFVENFEKPREINSSKRKEEEV